MLQHFSEFMGFLRVYGISSWVFPLDRPAQKRFHVHIRNSRIPVQVKGSMTGMLGIPGFWKLR